jgi:hypothetical protein
MVSRIPRMTEVAVAYLTVATNIAVPDLDAPLGVCLVESSLALIAIIFMVILLNVWLSSFRTYFFQQI